MKLEAKPSELYLEFRHRWKFRPRFRPQFRLKPRCKPEPTHWAQAQHHVDLLGSTNKAINKLTNQSSN